jgi:two-component system, chemotaxis family, chemotaxis protein CheY
VAQKILVVDDSSTVRTLMRSALERAGYEVDEAADGEEALARLDGRPLGLIVCDLSMPRLDGLGFLQQLRKHPRYKFTPLVLLTTESRAEVKAEARTLGAQAFMNKPCSPSQLVSTVQRLCH